MKQFRDDIRHSDLQEHIFYFQMRTLGVASYKFGISLLARVRGLGCIESSVTF